MQASGIPAKFSTPFGSSAVAADITVPIPTTTSTAGRASLSAGFPPTNFAVGGTPPFGQDFNGLFNQITAWNQWQQAGGAVPYDATFQSSIGGYPIGAIVESAAYPGGFWRSTTDANTTNPDSSGAGWVPFPNKTIQVFSASGTFTVPAGVFRLKVRLVGGGGGGGGGNSSYAGACGAAGGGAEVIVSVTPGQTIAVTVGAGGAGGGNGAGGGTSSFGAFASGTGGGGGSGAGSAASAGGAGGTGTAPGGIVQTGQSGSDGNIVSGATCYGLGGASVFGGGGRAGAGSGISGVASGSGGGGCYAATGFGGSGAPGIVIVEY